jgi:hypothetical protein
MNHDKGTTHASNRIAGVLSGQRFQRLGSRPLLPRWNTTSNSVGATRFPVLRNPRGQRRLRRSLCGSTARVAPCRLGKHQRGTACTATFDGWRSPMRAVALNRDRHLHPFGAKAARHRAAQRPGNHYAVSPVAPWYRPATNFPIDASTAAAGAPTRHSSTKQVKESAIIVGGGRSISSSLTACFRKPIVRKRNHQVRSRARRVRGCRGRRRSLERDESAITPASSLV